MPYFILVRPNMVLDARPTTMSPCGPRSSGFRLGLLTALPILSDSGLCGVRIGYSGGPATDSHRLSLHLNAEQFNFEPAYQRAPDCQENSGWLGEGSLGFKKFRKVGNVAGIDFMALRGFFFGEPMPPAL